MDKITKLRHNMNMESKTGVNTSELQEKRNKAYESLLTMDEHPEEIESSSMRWTTPKDLEERFKSYVATELSLQTAKVEEARPAFNTTAQADELLFSNTQNFLENGEHGKDSAERVLKRLYREQKLREYAFEKEKAPTYGENPKHQSEWSNILVAQMSIANLAGKLLGAEYKDKFHYPHLLWKNFE